MNEKIKCAICGATIGVLISMHNPICKKCIEHYQENPHINEHQNSVEFEGLGNLTAIVRSGINSTITSGIELYNLEDFYK